MLVFVTLEKENPAAQVGAKIGLSRLMAAYF